MVKKRILKSLSTASVIAAMAMMPLAASAAVYACSHLWLEAGFYHDVSWISGDEHLVTHTTIYRCPQCEDEMKETNSYYEGHFYTYDYGVGAWFCECGDSYTNP